VKRELKMKAVPILILVCAVLAQGCAKTDRAGTTRSTELAAVLKPLLKPATGPFWSEDEEEPPGWCEPANRQAVRDFVAKYPETEEAYQAEVWLAMAGAYTERNPMRLAEKRRQEEVVQRLKAIGHATARAGTEKMAELERAFRLYRDEPGDHTEFYQQVDEILSHIQDFKSEKDGVFQRYLEVAEMRAGDIEPTLRLLAAREKGFDGHLDRALEMARELKQKFPGWEPQSVNSLIEMYELYQRGQTAATPGKPSPDGARDSAPSSRPPKSGVGVRRPKA